MCLFLNKFKSIEERKGEITEHIQSHIEDVNLYFQNIDEVSEFKQQLDSDEYDDGEDMIQVFTAKPDKFRKNKIFNFMPKELKPKEDSTQFDLTPGFSHNPFSYGVPLENIDSGATPLFKLKKNYDENEGMSTFIKLCRLLARCEC